MSVVPEHKCLVIMPFGRTAEEKLSYRLVYEHIIRRALEKARAVGERIDAALLLDRPISAALEKRLRNAPVIVADISGNNPNVLFELGFRKAQGKPFVCISSKPGDAAFWAKVFQILDYTSDGAVNKIADAVRSALIRSGVRLRVYDALDVLADSIKEIEEFNNTFQDRIAAWRVMQAHDQVSRIQQMNWDFDARTPTAYIAHMFERLVALLEPGEEYCTVTNLNFWSSRAVGEAAFLAANTEAAMRGVTIRRVFLIDNKDWKSDRQSVESVLQEHSQALVELKQQSKNGRLAVKCLLSDNFETDFKHYGHFGLASQMGTVGHSNTHYVLVVPHYAPDRTISSLKFIFSKERHYNTEISDHVAKFQRAFDRAQDLSTLLGKKRGASA